MSNLLLREDVFNHQPAINSLINDSNPVLTSIQQNVIADNGGKSNKKSGIEEFEKYLFSEERLDASSPDLWPEQIPGMTDFLARSSPINSELFQSDPLVGEKQETPEWLKELDQDDMNMLHGFGSLTTFALLDRVKELQDLSFQLGLEEAREMTRGRFLGVLSSENNPPSTSSGQTFIRD